MAAATLTRLSFARTFAIGGSVVTTELFKPNAVKAPNICEHFKLPRLDLEGSMEKEGMSGMR